MKQIRCKKCGHRYGDGFESCPYCGAPKSSTQSTSGSWLFPSHVGMGAKSLFVVAVLVLAVTGGLAVGGFFKPQIVEPPPPPTPLPTVAPPLPSTPPPTPEPTQEPTEETGPFYYDVFVHYLWYNGEWTEKCYVTDKEPLIIKGRMSNNSVFDIKELDEDLKNAGFLVEKKSDPSFKEQVQWGDYTIKHNEGTANDIAYRYLSCEYEESSFSLEGSTEDKPSQIHLWFFAFPDSQFKTVSGSSENGNENNWYQELLQHLAPQDWYWYTLDLPSGITKGPIPSSCETLQVRYLNKQEVFILSDKQTEHTKSESPYPIEIVQEDQSYIDPYRTNYDTIVTIRTKPTTD